MSGWDAPTGSWDSGEEPEGSRSDEQGYQQTQPTGGHWAAGGEGILRAGRRGLPGYEQAQSYDQPGGYDQGTAAYAPGAGAQQATYGPGTVPASTARYGQGPDEEPGYGTVPQAPVGSEPQTGQASQGPSVFRRAVGSGSQSAGSYDRGESGAYPAFGSQEASVTAWSGADDQDYGTQAYRQQQPAEAGYGQQPAEAGYGQQPGLGQDYRTLAFGQPGYDQPGYGQRDYGPGAPGYQTEAYPQQGLEPQGYAQGGHADQGYGHPGYGQNGYGQASGTATGYQQDSYAQGAYDGYGQNGAQGGYGQDGYGQGGYSPDAYRQDSYGQGGYSQDAYGQPGVAVGRPSGPAYGDDGVNAPGVQPRSGPSRSAQRSPQRLSGIRMIVYLVGAVLGVALIVLLVIHMTKTGSNTAAGSTSSPSTSTSPSAAAGTASGLVLTQAAKAGTHPLNATATRDYTKVADEQAVPIAAAIKARGAGHTSKELVAVYDLSSVSSVAASDFRAIGFVGFDGTFNPDAVIKYMKTQLASTRTVNPGQHGGKMICGYNTSTGTEASECLWVTPTTFGMVDFIVGQAEVKYPGASNLALEVRNAVEVNASA
jgi:hypothetical protein